MSAEINVLDRLLEITLLLQQDLARSFEATGLTLARTHLLWELRRLGPSTQQSLATALQVSPRNITGLVDALEATGFVSRGPHPTDRRATLVAPTELGARTMSVMEVEYVQLSEQLVAGLSESHVIQLAAGLDAVAERLRTLVESSRSEAAAKANERAQS